MPDLNDIKHLPLTDWGPGAGFIQILDDRERFNVFKWTVALPLYLIRT
jgi:hypothetical protein